MSKTSLTPLPEASKLTPELVRQLADRVYALWLQESQIENERRRLTGRTQAASKNR
jgi:hypothetical protein